MVLLSQQVGLAVVVLAWWVAGAAVFSRVEGAAEHETVSKMAELRTDLVLGLATELRQVGIEPRLLPHPLPYPFFASSFFPCPCLTLFPIHTLPAFTFLSPYPASRSLPSLPLPLSHFLTCPSFLPCYFFFPVSLSSLSCHISFSRLSHSLSPRTAFTSLPSLSHPRSLPFPSLSCLLVLPSMSSLAPFHVLFLFLISALP